MKKNVLFLCPLCLLLALCSACKEVDLNETIEKLENIGKSVDPEYVISIHEIVRYPKAEALEREVDTFSGMKVCVNTNSYLHSRNIKKIEIAPNPDKEGFFDLILHLDKRGMMLWTSTAAQFRGRKMALVVDGICYRAFSPRLPSDDDIDEDSGEVTVLLDGPIDFATATKIAKFSESNYKHFN